MVRLLKCHLIGSFLLLQTAFLDGVEIGESSNKNILTNFLEQKQEFADFKLALDKHVDGLRDGRVTFQRAQEMLPSNEMELFKNFHNLANLLMELAELGALEIGPPQFGGSEVEEYLSKIEPKKLLVDNGDRQNNIGCHLARLIWQHGGGTFAIAGMHSKVHAYIDQLEGLKRKMYGIILELSGGQKIQSVLKILEKLRASRDGTTPFHAIMHERVAKPVVDWIGDKFKRGNTDPEDGRGAEGDWSQKARENGIKREAAKIDTLHWAYTQLGIILPQIQLQLKNVLIINHDHRHFVQKIKGLLYAMDSYAKYAALQKTAQHCWELAGELESYAHFGKHDAEMVDEAFLKLKAGMASLGIEDGISDNLNDLGKIDSIDVFTPRNGITLGEKSEEVLKNRANRHKGKEMALENGGEHGEMENELDGFEKNLLKHINKMVHFYNKFIYP